MKIRVKRKYSCQNVQVMTLWMIFIEKLLEPGAINPFALQHRAVLFIFRNKCAWIYLETEQV